MRFTKERRSNDTTALPGVCLARQPIFGTAGDVAGYELVSWDRTTGRETGAANVVRAVLSIGLDQLTAGRVAYVTFTPEMVVAGAYTALPRDGIVVELVDDVEPDDRVELACERLVNAGYALALHADGAGCSERLLELATVVKVDVHEQSPARLDAIAQELATYDVRLLAERVDTARTRALCAGLGYELFHGTYYARPEMVRRRVLHSDELAIMRELNELRDGRANDTIAEAVFASDVKLASRLLRAVNGMGRADRGTESVRDALQHGTRDELGTWLLLLLASAIAARESASRELLHLAVQRARLCALLAGSAGRAHDAGSMFLVGLFSLLDAVGRMPIEALLEPMALGPLVREALLERTGPYAATLALVEAWEQGEWETVRRQASAAGIDASQVSTCYVQSLAWTRDRLRSLNVT